MSKISSKKHLLIQAVLSSTLLITPQVYATQFGPAATPGPVSTSAQVDNIIEILGGGITTAGQIGGAAVNAVNLNSANGQVIVDVNNTINGSQAIYAIGVGPAIAINVTGTNGIVNIQGAGSGVTSDATAATSDTIFVDATGANISNAGIIINGNAAQNTYSAIHLSANGTNATINNLLGGTIQNASNSTAKAATILIDGTGLVLNNAGTITEQGTALTNKDVITANASFTAINNLSNGLIQQISGPTDKGNTINVLGVGLNAINNSLNAKVVNLGTNLGAGLGGGNAIMIGASSSGNLINAGEISSNTGDAIFLGANLNAIINSGQIESTNPIDATIYSGANGVVLLQGLTNSGDIVNLAGGNAINFQTKTTQATIFQNGGSIHGQILLASKDSAGGNNVFTMTGGVIGGNVVGDSTQGNHLALSGGTITGNLVGGGGAGQNIFTLSGGTISGKALLGANGDTVNLSGTQVSIVQGGAGNDTINASGGGFNSLDGDGGSNTLNVTGTFTANGVINNVQTIHVQNPGTVFTANSDILNLDNLFAIDPSTTFVPNNFIQGKGDILNNGVMLITQTPLINSPLIDLSSGLGVVTNNGTIKINPTATLSIYGGNGNTVLDNTAGSILNVQVAGISTPNGPTTAGQILAYSAFNKAITLDTGSFVQPEFTGFIPQNQTYDIATVIGGGQITDNSVLIEPPSAVVSFTKTLESNSSVMRLSANRNPYIALSNTNVTTGVASSLDILAQGNGPQNINLLNLLSQLDHLPTQASVEQAMQSLAPFFNYGLVASSYAGMNMVFEGLNSRMEELRYLERQAKRGQSYGDPANTIGVWGKILGENIHQSDRDDVAGFNVDAGGLVFGTDIAVTDCVTLGIAGSYIKAKLDDENITPKDATVESWQGTAYGWFEFTRGLYLDTQIAYAHNDYNTNRIIQVNQINTTAIASFHGAQWGAQADLGIAFPYGYYYFSPFARLKYLHLDMESYVEQGADFLNLAVTNSDVDLFMGGIGLKVGGIHHFANAVWVPEFTALFGANFDDDAEQTFANFSGGGPVFTTNGVKPSSTLLDLGLGLNIHLNQSNIVSVKYNLELRSSYNSNAGYLQYYYRWG